MPNAPHLRQPIPCSPCATPVHRGCQLIQHIVASGIVPAALEFLDGSALEVAARAFPGGLLEDARFLVLAEADGSCDEAARTRDELIGTMSEFSGRLFAPRTASERQAL